MLVNYRYSQVDNQDSSNRDNAFFDLVTVGISFLTALSRTSSTMLASCWGADALTLLSAPPRCLDFS